MAKLQMCRICLLENVHMFEVANKSLQETYEKLANVAFVTEDRRPMLACSFCFTKLKHCCQFERKCLDAEKWFTQMLNNSEPKPISNRRHVEFSSGFVKTSIEIISIVDNGRSKADSIDTEPGASESQHDVLEIKVERKSDDFGSEKYYADENSIVYVESRPPQHPASDSEDDVPLVEIKTEVETVKEEMEDSSKKQCGDKNTKRAPITKKPKLKDDLSTRKQTKSGRSKSKNNWTAQIRTPASLPKSKDAIFKTKPVQTGTDSVFNMSDLINNAIDTNFGGKRDAGKILNRQNIKSDDLNTRNVKENSFKCDVCDRSFSDKGNLRRHVIGHGEAPFECYICGRGFHAKSHLAKHHRTHTGEKPFECDECHRCFSERSNLIKHLRRHEGDKPYKCDVCQRSFNQKYHLQTHSIVHTGEKPFKCDVCQQGFNRLYNFKQHYRTHTGEKPHECIMCPKTFTHKTSLTKHMRNHTGEKPFKCFVCQRSFTHKQSLDMHFRKHTGEKPYKCEVCQKCFTQGSHLKQHLARNHIGDKP